MAIDSGSTRSQFGIQNHRRIKIKLGVLSSQNQIKNGTQSATMLIQDLNLELERKRNNMDSFQEIL